MGLNSANMTYEQLSGYKISILVRDYRFESAAPHFNIIF